MRGGEGYLFDFGEVVLRVAVEGEFAKGPEGDFALWPDFGEVEDVPLELLGLIRAEHLHVARPGRVVAVLDRVEEILRVPVGVFGRHAVRLVAGEGFGPLVGFAVDLNVVEGAIRFGEFVRVAGIAVHVTVRIGRTAVGK